MEKANKDIRQAIEEAGLKYYLVAKEYGLTDGNFTRLLRFELPQEKKDRIFRIIQKLKSTETS